MKELVKLIHSQQEDGEEIIDIADRHITADRTVHIYDETVFRNCEIEVISHNAPRFIIGEDVSVTFQSCRFIGTLKGQEDGAHSPVISAEEGSSVTFQNCRFEDTDSILDSDGEVNFLGCEVTCGGKEAHNDKERETASDDQYLPRRSAAVGAIGAMVAATAKMPFEASKCRLISADGEDVTIANCNFSCEPNDCRVSLSAPHGDLQNCVLNGIYEIKADILRGCTVKNCITVNIQTEDGFNEATNCRFEDCDKIFATDATFSDCEITNLHSGFTLEESTVTKCAFHDITPDSDGMINLVNTDFNNCAFENITLKNDYYLISSDNGSSLNNCSFKNCRTGREDLELITNGEFEGFFQNRWVEDDICYGCTGLDRVIYLEDWEGED